MADRLTELYQADFPADDMSGFVYYQKGFSQAAQLMRQRALALAQKLAQKPTVIKPGDANALVNAIGALADIPDKQ